MGSRSLTAPAPRTADGKPNLSGVWVNGGFGIAGRRAAAAGGPTARWPAQGQPPTTTEGRRCPRDEDGEAPHRPMGLPMQTLAMSAAGFLMVCRFTPWAAELKKTRMAGNSKDNPDARCLPMGFMQFHTHPQPRKIIQTPAVTSIIYEANYGLRTIFSDGRSLPGPDAQPFWYGYSVGKWDGDTFVVESSGFRDDGWLDVQGSPFSEQLKLTERFRRLNYGTLQIDITIDDPKAYTKPFTVRVTQRLTPGSGDHRVHLQRERPVLVVLERRFPGRPTRRPRPPVRTQARIRYPLWPPMHPAGLRCSSLTYARYARSSRLAGRAPRRPQCTPYSRQGPKSV